MSTSDETLTYEQIADQIKMSVHYVKRHAHEWPHLRFGRAYRFSEAHLAEIKKMHERAPRKRPALDPMRPIGHGARRRSA